MQPTTEKTPANSVSKLVKDYFLAIGGAAVVALLLRVYVVEAFRIPTDFMAPVLLPGDHIFVNKLAYGGLFGGATTAPARGDVIIFAFPSDPTKDYIKRVIAVGSDTVEIRDGRVLVNDKLITRSRGDKKDHEKGEAYEYEEALDGRHYRVRWDEEMSREALNMTKVTVPAGQLFVLGDNRAKGQDSRSYGFLSVGSVKGKASVIWFSIDAQAGVRWARLFTTVN